MLDSVFSASLSTDMQQALINSNLQRSTSDGNNLSLTTNNVINYKMASGDNAGS